MYNAMSPAPTFLYWCKNVKTGANYNFMSFACLDIGITVQDENGEDNIIVDMAVEFPIGCHEEDDTSW